MNTGDFDEKFDDSIWKISGLWSSCWSLTCRIRLDKFDWTTNWWFLFNFEPISGEINWISWKQILSRVSLSTQSKLNNFEKFSQYTRVSLNSLSKIQFGSDTNLLEIFWCTNKHCSDHCQEFASDSDKQTLFKSVSKTGSFSRIFPEFARWFWNE